jgi:hypothetical protein
MGSLANGARLNAAIRVVGQNPRNPRKRNDDDVPGVWPGRAGTTNRHCPRSLTQFVRLSIVLACGFSRP